MSKSVTTTGLLFKKFYADPKIWKSGEESWYVDDQCVRVGDTEDMDTIYNRYGDNFERLPDDAMITVITGYMGWQGRGHEPALGHDGELSSALSLWLKEQSTLSLVATLDVPKDIAPDRLQKIVAVLEALGAKVQGAPEAPAISADEKQQMTEAVNALLSPAEAPAARRRPGSTP